MRILALEFSSERRSAAAQDPSGRAAEATESPNRKKDPFALIQEALSAAGLAPDQIDAVAVGLGPGSYTGIRAALAVAQGWSLARGAAIIPVSTVEALVRRLADQGFEGRVRIVIDAQRREFYAADFRIAGGKTETLAPLRLLSKAEAESRPSGTALAGPGASRFFPGALDVYPLASTTAALAAAQPRPAPPESLQPVYLRQTAFKKAPPPRRAGGGCSD